MRFDHAIDVAEAAVAELEKANTHSRWTTLRVGLSPDPDDFAAPLDHGELTTEQKLEIEDRALGHRIEGLDQHAVDRDIGGDLVDEVVEAVKPQQHRLLEGNPNLAQNRRRLGQRSDT